MAVSRSGNPWIDGLTDGYRWGTSAADPVIGYTFIGDTQLTISYMESEAKYSAPGGISNSKTEGFAGISLAKNF